MESGKARSEAVNVKENKFRGKPFNDKSFVFGKLLQNDENSYIVADCETESYDEENTDLFATVWNEVIPETVGQYINVSDMSEQLQELYEDDVIEVTIYSHSEPAKIVCQQRRKIEFKDGMFGVQWTKTDFLSLKHHFADSCSIIKIGNIWDNPELVNTNE